MQVLRATMFDMAVTITLTGETSDDRSPMTAEPVMFEDMLKSLCRGQPDGRGVPMDVDAYTAIGLAAALKDIGVEVEGLEPAPPDMDGLTDEMIDY